MKNPRFQDMSDDFSEVIASVGQRLAPLDGRRLEALAQNRRDYTIGGASIGGGLLGFLLFFALDRAAQVAGFVVLAIGVVVGVVFIIRGANRSRKFLREVKWHMMRGLLDAIQPGMQYDPDRGISKEMFRAARLFSESADRYESEDLIRGRVGETDIMLSEVHAQYRSTSTDSKGRTRTTYHTFFRGLFLMADFHKHFSGTLRVMPGYSGLLGGIGRALAGFRPFSAEKVVQLEDPEFDEMFIVYGSDDIEARYILSPSMMRRILDLRRRWNDQVRLSFFESSVCLAISHKNNLFEPSLKTPVGCGTQLGRIASEVRTCLDLVEDLSLNTRIWSKE